VASRVHAYTRRQARPGGQNSAGRRSAPSEGSTAQSEEIAAALEALNTARFWLDGQELRLLKRDLFRDYLQIAPLVLPHLRDRPVTMTRYPNGINDKKFYQKSPRESAPPFVVRFIAFSERNNADDEYFVCTTRRRSSGWPNSVILSCT
jgi:hypothetical protein